MNKNFRNTACVATLVIYIVGLFKYGTTIDIAVYYILKGIFLIVVPILVIGLIKLDKKEPNGKDINAEKE